MLLAGVIRRVSRYILCRLVLGFKQSARWTSEAGLQKLVFQVKLLTVLLCSVYHIIMSQIVLQICEQLGGVRINCILHDGEPRHEAIDIATALKGQRHRQSNPPARSRRRQMPARLL